jgi:hypothetical protein
MTTDHTRTQDTVKLLLLLLQVSLPLQILLPGVSVKGNQSVTAGVIVPTAAAARLLLSDFAMENLGTSSACIVWRFSLSYFLGVLDLDCSLDRCLFMEPDHCSKMLRSIIRLE